ncbi:hypothetical protein [Caulobacter segnis]
MLRLFALVALLGGPVAAQTHAPPPALPALADIELADSRGGFTILNGQDLSFSAVMRSYVDGCLVLESRLSAGDQGRLLSSTGSSAPLAASTLDGLAAAGLTLGTSLDGSPVYVSDDRRTVFLHRVGDGQIASLLVNTASQRDLRQETNLVLDLPGFDLTQAAMREGLAARALADDIRTALAGH